MTKDWIDERLSVARPSGLSALEREAMFARIVTSPGADVDDPWSVPSGYRTARTVVLAGAATVAVVAAVGVPLLLTGGSVPRHKSDATTCGWRCSH